SKDRARSLRTRQQAMILPTEPEGTAQHSTILPSTSTTQLSSPTMALPALLLGTRRVTAEFISRSTTTGKPQSTARPERPATPTHCPARPLKALHSSIFRDLSTGTLTM